LVITTLDEPWRRRISTERMPPLAARRSTTSGVLTPIHFGGGENDARTPDTLWRHARYPRAPTTNRDGMTMMVNQKRNAERGTSAS
jgi:hypothetical protein